MKSRRTAFSDGTAAQVSNLIMLSGIKIFDVRERGDGCVFSVNSKDFGAAKKVLESKSKSFVPLGNDKGGLLKRVVKRVGVWVGLIIFTAVAVAFSQCVTKISVSGNEEVRTEEIEEAVLKELELPSIKSVVDAERIKQNVCDIEMISDASVEIEGNTVFVNVLERLPQVKTPEGDVKSLYDALVTKIVLYEGECKTRVGDTVRAGDVLITKTDGNALGDVYGRVWIHEQTVVPFSRIVLGQHLLDRRFRLNPDRRSDNGPVFEYYQRGNAGYTVFLRNAWHFIDIQLAYLDLAFPLFSNFGYGRCEHPAGAAPGRPEINQDGKIGFQNLRLKISFVQNYFSHKEFLPSHFALFISYHYSRRNASRIRK